MKTYTYKKSVALFDRAVQVIPCGIYGHLSPTPLVPVEHYPFYMSRAKGAKFWDVDGNEFIDYLCAYGPMILGYNDPKVDAAAKAQLDLGNCVTSPGPAMVELAEAMVDLVDGMKWAFFAKNGGDATSYSLMIARAATGRKKIILVRGGYHGVAPWAQSMGHPGIIEEDKSLYLYVDWNDFEGFEKVVKENKGQIAGFISTPYHHPTFTDSVMPAAGYWQNIEKLCRNEGIVLIVDDVRCGFRLDLAGSHKYFGFNPDLVCFCKAIANGYPISALMGTEAMRNACAKVFYTGSYWYSAVPMAAAIACLKELKRINAPAVLKKVGEKLAKGLSDVVAANGYTLVVSGSPGMPFLRIAEDPSNMLHQEWCGESTRRGAFFCSHHNWFVSTAHTDKDIKRTIEIADEAFTAVKKRGAR
ncbi:MAG: aminotransferase class III-fold pyridoxal phosphate-dependent enzyme [Spirochaetes bacterium]|nr:MAG: aminotransferase class III-fold pyridoxal phosphate-dependent enzyme [Spirochaetota bacterium]